MNKKPYEIAKRQLDRAIRNIDIANKKLEQNSRKVQLTLLLPATFAHHRWLLPQHTWRSFSKKVDLPPTTVFRFTNPTLVDLKTSSMLTYLITTNDWQLVRNIYCFERERIQITMREFCTIYALNYNTARRYLGRQFIILTYSDFGWWSGNTGMPQQARQCLKPIVRTFFTRWDNINWVKELRLLHSKYID